MQLSSHTIQFIRENMNADTTKLLLSASKFPEVDVPFAVDQILARRQIREKLPLWYANEQIILPSRIAAEQCSSEQTAFYKQRLVKGNIVCDLTGGFGVDSYYLSGKTTQSYYIERFETYCEAARHNFAVLGASHIEVMNGDSRELLATIPQVDTFYVDPARRSDVNKRLFALQDCEPNILEMKAELLQKASRLIIKISPMADIRITLDLLPETSEVHVISVRNECKELLFVLDRDKMPCAQPIITCINYTTEGREESFSFSIEEEAETLPSYAKEVESYLYEPNSSILKAGGFKSIASRFGLNKLQVNSHLYTSIGLAENFPGRVFKVEEVIDFASKNIKKLSASIPKANITVRNFPLTVEELRKKTGIRDGGEVYLFGSVIGKDQKILIKGCKV